MAALKSSAAPQLSLALRKGTGASRALQRGIIEKVSATAIVDDAQASRRAAKSIRAAGMVDAPVDGPISDAHAMAVAAEAGCSAIGTEYPQLRRFASRGLGNRATMRAEIDAGAVSVSGRGVEVRLVLEQAHRGRVRARVGGAVVVQPPSQVPLAGIVGVQARGSSVPIDETPNSLSALP